MAAQSAGEIWCASLFFVAPLTLTQSKSQLGTTFRYRPDAVCVNTPTGYQKIFGAHGNVKKGDSYKMWRKTVDFVNLWNATSIPVHARKRRVLNYALSETALKGAETFLHGNVDRWLEILGGDTKTGNWSEGINMADQVTYLVFDILGDLSFGQSFGMIELDSKLKHIPELMVGYLALVNPVRRDHIFSFCYSSFILTAEVVELTVSRLPVRHYQIFGCGCSREALMHS